MTAVLAAVLLLTFGSLAAAQTSSGPRQGGVQPGSAADVQVRLLDLPSIRQMFSALAQQRASRNEGERAAAWADFSLLVDAVVGRTTGETLSFDDLIIGTGPGRGPRVLAAPDLSARDTTAYQALALGYSARETADIVSGRITQRALDTASGMLAIGQTRDAAANYLDSQYQRMIEFHKPPTAPTTPAAPALPPGRRELLGPFDLAIEKYSTRYNVRAALVRAMIMTESRFDPGARSPAGAIGLMQLMPATARELGVNPRIPEQNIEGGVRYFSGLLRMFGGTELALIVYNGGPGFARRYARRETALYGETRQYVRRVLARLAGEP